jgi:FkbM family methyltransferase
MISIQRIKRFLRKTPEQRRLTERFAATMWLAKLPLAPHRVHLKVDKDELVDFWWSYFPATFSSAKSLFDYWGDDVGELCFLWKFLRPGMTFLDVGAYHGIYAIIAAKRMGPKGHVVAFEPSPRDRRRLKLHLRCNGIKTVTVEPYAVTSEKGKASFLVVVDGYTNMNSLRQPAVDHPVKQVEVETTALDEYLKYSHTDLVDLVKIDAEGGEIEIFRGADRLLSCLRPLVICEVLDKVTAQWGYPACEIVSWLKTYDYEWFDILQNGCLLPHRLRKEYPDVRNYLAAPREKKDRFLSLLSS